MTKRLSAVILALAALNAGAAHAGPPDPPNPEMFAHAEDRQRARLLTTPCTEADIGHGCDRHDGRAFRKVPCSYRIDVRTTGSLPTDRCFKMEAPRRYRGIWVDEFEGQKFIPEGTRPREWPRDEPESAGWMDRLEQARLSRIWLDASRITVDRKSHPRGSKRFIEFIGRKTLYAGTYGHMGMSGHEIIVDRVISLRECSATGACG
ncbi:hypothetical protein [Sphingomonas sp.]|uniref:hypothetical protein n=1 Tax=Sphingomonas sp. TaxID=28214 RepID=UPI0035C7A1F0